jgi:hypothetical protein
MMPSQSYFQEWAQIDRNYLPHSETTGVYSCYCQANIGLTSFWKVWQDPQLEICKDYLSAMVGGSLMTVPLGILNGILTKLIGFISILLLKKIGFHSRASERTTTVVMVSFASYIMMAVLPLVQFYYDYNVPKKYSPEWVRFFGKLIYMSMITQHLLPYIGTFLTVWKVRGCCCCKDSSFKRQQVYSAEQRYISLLTLIFVTWTYGFSIPFLFEFTLDIILL